MAILEELTDDEEKMLLDMGEDAQSTEFAATNCKRLNGISSNKPRNFSSAVVLTGSGSQLYRRSINPHYKMRKLLSNQKTYSPSSRISPREESLLGNPLLSRLLWGLLFVFWVSGVCVVIHRLRELSSRNYTMGDLVELWNDGAPTQ